MSTQLEKNKLMTRFLNLVEKTGNKLPDPIILFFSLCIVLAVVTAIVSQFDTRVKHPGTGEMISVRNVLSHDGVVMFLNDAVKNFSTFPALGIVLAVMLGIGVAEKSGYFDKLMVHIVSIAPERVLLPVIIFVGMLGNIAGDAAPIVLPPLVAMIFIKLGYHPVAGLALAYAATLGGFAANIFIGLQDALVYAFTEPAAHLIDKSVSVMSVIKKLMFAKRMARASFGEIDALFIVSFVLSCDDSYVPRCGITIRFVTYHKIGNKKNVLAAIKYQFIA
ncbi:hypothetical protein GLV93_12890, partial [Staphylococcus agnetis]